MSEHGPGIDELDARLAELDRRLSLIQDELVPVDGADAAQDPSGIEPQTRLLASLRELLGAYEALMAELSAADRDRSARELVVCAGPFPSTDGLRAFERALSGMPGVLEVIVREYAGEDRAIVDVRLGDPTS